MYHLSDLRENAEIFSEKQSLFPLLLTGREKYKINLLAMGDVGGMLLTSLVLLGGDTIGRLGIFDIKKQCLSRYEAEMNQIAAPVYSGRFPTTEIICDENDVFDCDVFVFCASKEVPDLNSGSTDVRMAQYIENKKIVEYYARLAAAKSFGGLFAVISDPVDLLCKSAYIASGLKAGQFRGFGLGVMNGRALYYAMREPKFEQYIRNGRVFGPHGVDLVVADSVLRYNDELSRELTEKVVTENIRIRQTGWKPFIAPAISSGAVSIIEMLKGEWHYSSNFIGRGDDGAFFGALSRIRMDRTTEFEDTGFDEKLFDRIRCAYENLKKIK